MSTSPIVNVASNTSSGAAGGSVIDVSTLVSELVAATEAPQQQLIQQQTTSVSTEISAVGTLQSALSTFQSSLSALDTPSAFDALSATSSDTTAFTATANSGATLGAYTVSITALAQAQQLVSTTAYTDSSTVVGTGTLQLTLGGSSFSVNIDSTNDTLSGIAAAINSASGNPGIEASVVTGAIGSGTSGAHLVLTSTLTGASNTMAITETDSGGGLSGLTYSTGGANYTQETAAQDASFSIAGVSHTSASNTVTDALSGVTLSLLNTTTSNATLTVADDNTSIESNVQTFVSAYNTLQSSLASLGGYNATTNTAGPLMGNAALTSAQSQIRSALYSIVDTGSATYTSLASVGITSNSDGSLSLNTGTLSSALSSNFSAVSSLFSGTSGVATTLNTVLTNQLSSTGPIQSLSKSLVQENDGLGKKSSLLSEQMTELTASLTEQYASLNTLLSSLQSTSSYLTQAFATLPSNRSSSGG